MLDRTPRWKGGGPSDGICVTPRGAIRRPSMVIGCACFQLRFIPGSAGNRTVTSIPKWLRTDHPREVIEVALAHVLRNRVVAAYALSNLFERRCVLMDTLGLCHRDASSSRLAKIGDESRTGLH